MFRIFSLLPFTPGGALDTISRQYAWTVPAVAVLGFASSALEGVGITLLIPLLSTLFAAEDAATGGLFGWLTRFGSAYAPETRLVALAAVIVILMVLKSTLTYLNGVLVSWTDGRISHKMRQALSQCLLDVGYAFLLREEPGRLVNIVATESWRASDAIRALYQSVASMGSILVFAVLLLILDWRLLIAVAAGILLLRLVDLRLMRSVRRLSSTVSAANHRLASRMLTGVLAMRLIRLSGEEAREQERFADASETVRRRMLDLDRRTLRISPLQEVLHGILLVAILLAATLGPFQVPVPILITFLVLLQRMQPHLRGLEAGRATLAAAAGSVTEVEWLLAPSGKPAGPAGTRPAPRLEQGITFDDVDFDYGTPAESGGVLDGATFTIGAGRATAIIGPSGSGKSTVVNLITRLFEPVAGRIRVDGVPLAEIDPHAWRRQIGFAGQDIDLLEESIAANIAFGTRGLSQADIVAAAKAADAHDFIARLPEGYGTAVGSRGLSLSGGQRQRISIARALARKPRLLILDEATSAVDGASESNILSILKQRRSGTTVIVISHRASTLAACDDGIVIEDGRILECGRLSALKHAPIAHSIEA